jgi:3',5'-cyclic-AMP phosphodiesterase
MNANSEVILVQVGDLHIGADWVDAIDPLQSLSATIDLVRQLDRKVDAVLVLGDLAQHGAATEYRQVRDQLARLEAPVHVAMGNHDDRETLCHQFGFNFADGPPLRYAAEVGPARLLVLDTTIPGHDQGQLDAESLDWLEHELASFPDTPTVLAMHHPPVLTGSPAWDSLALASDSRRRLSQTLNRHPQVTQIFGGHLHRPLVTQFASRPVLVGPSTYVQFPLSVRATELDPTDEPPGYVIHLFSEDGQLTSYFQNVPPPAKTDATYEAVHHITACS